MKIELKFEEVSFLLERKGDSHMNITVSDKGSRGMTFSICDSDRKELMDSLKIMGVTVKMTDKQESMDRSPCEVKGGYIHIKFQCGVVSEKGVNGCCIIDVLQVLLDRLEGFQEGEFNCEENRKAIIGLTNAREWLKIRTRRRQQQGVEGTYNKH